MKGCALFGKALLAHGESLGIPRGILARERGRCGDDL